MEVLLDVRLVPWSQRPEYRKQALARELNKVGIEYVHLREAGNPFRPKKGEQKSLAQCVRDYKRHLEAAPAVLQMVAAAIRDRRSAFLCFEAKHRDCHRSVLLAALGAAFSTFEIKTLEPTSQAPSIAPGASALIPATKRKRNGGGAKVRATQASLLFPDAAGSRPRKRRSPA